MPVPVKEAFDAAGEYKKAFEARDYEKAGSLLGRLKCMFTEFPSFLDPSASSATKEQEVMIVRDVFEHACLIAASRVKEDPQEALHEFGRHFEVLRQYFVDFSGSSPSERRLLVLGLNLLRLLALGETKHFHMELESIAVEDQASNYVKDVVQLERYLQEGSYNKLLDARKKVPSSEYTPMMDMLLDTVRRGVFECAASAYNSLSVQGARELLMFSGPQGAEEMSRYIRAETERRRAVAEQQGEDFCEPWRLQGDRFVFGSEEDHRAHRREVLPYDSMMVQQLGYAHEMQRVV
eukprot:TRINITY_DN31073_c0_g1_i1.p1 TRINITY_DN31073_c0_g1~~TRINITY_DN31073_c0_g1_i1.p1  ORF type:complete len:293 (+),score=114.84 TRINITY_DN31073_c0_g1_i1:67-945(+)